MVLRQLAQRVDDLPTLAQRATARRLLARPTDGSQAVGGEPKYGTAPASELCDAHVCVHWVTTGPQRVASTDSDHNGVPDQVDTTRSDLAHVYAKEVEKMGYRSPRTDTASGDHGSNGKLDIYLGDLGEQGLYGYCTTDQPHANRLPKVSAYCVLDNDYDPRQFPEHTPLQNLQVTAAHEFFHAVQYAYDWLEDLWFMEGTAVWMEDQVYDGVNDNRQYLVYSPLSYPEVPVDFNDQTYQPYGSWIFWRFLTEWAGKGRRDDPTLIRQVWISAGRGANYSTRALTKVLAARRTSLPEAFRTFGTWIRNPGRYFREGSHYSPAQQERRFTVTKARRSVAPFRVPMNHLSNSFVRFTPGRSLAGTWKLRVSVNMADRSRGSVAQLALRRRNGSLTVRSITLSRTGNGTRTFDFRRSIISYLDLDMVNASARFRCHRGTTLSCGGVALDDDLRATVTAKAVR